MLARAGGILGIGAILISAPVWAAGGRYDPNYPVCMEVYDTTGPRLECRYTSYEQCRQGTIGSGGSCFNNPNYTPPPAGAAPAEATPADPGLPPEGTPAKSAGRYDPNYPVCMEVYDTTGGRYECRYTSYEQCRQFTFGSGGTCFNNPSYAPPPPPAPVQAEPAPPAKPAKRVKSAKAAKPPQAPPPAPAQSAPPPPASSR
jgi:hypothetical protein